MPEYPVTPRTKFYRGSKQSEQRKTASHNRDAALIADTINKMVRESRSNPCVLMYHDVARECGLSDSRVREIGVIGGGHNGITVANPFASDGQETK